MDLQKLYSYTRQAIDAYRMIEPNDKIAIGISGGKDSLTLLYALAGLKKFYPIPFEITAITVDLGYEGFDLTSIGRLCEQLNVAYHILPTEIANIVSLHTESDSPCSICARLRKGALNDEILRLGCNKVAYAHHKDDVIETMLLSLIYEGRFYCFSPVTYLDKTNLTVIRPLIYVLESEIQGFRYKYQLPVVKNPCPIDGHSKRSYTKELLAQINRDNPGVKKRLFTAIESGTIDGWNIHRF